LSFSAIDACKTDVYYGNGILTKDEDAYAIVADVLEPSIQKLYTSEEEKKKYISRSHRPSMGMYTQAPNSYNLPTDTSAFYNLHGVCIGYLSLRAKRCPD
jgi:hypothetical protein